MTVVGITVGDPFGIGPELVLKYLQTLDTAAVGVRVYASADQFMPLVDVPGIAFVEDSELRFPAHAGQLKERAAFCLRALEMASADAHGGTISSLVTAPLDKSIVRHADPTFTGHTEYLAKLSGVDRTVMMLDNTELRVVLLTNHLALRDVAASLTIEGIEDVVQITARGMSNLGISRPTFAMTALNPHAGEIVSDSEETKVLIPAISRLQQKGLNIVGPFPADSFFPKARNGAWDAIFSPYHDQGLVAVKYPGIDKVVNITLGMPYIRVSPGHGVAYDIVGKNVANIRSFARAMDIAITRRLNS